MSTMICSVCFESQAICLKECYCAYCKNCYESGNQCGCNSNFNFMAIKETHEETINSCVSIPNFISNSVPQVLIALNGMFNSELSKATNLLSVIQHQKRMYFQHLIRRLKELEIEKNSLRPTEAFGKKPIVDLNPKSKFDFSLFESSWFKHK